MNYLLNNITLSITSKCNLSCKHCLATKVIDMSTEQILNFIDRLGEIKVFSVALFGGEPFVRRDFFQILNHITKYPINLSINTNGTLLDEETVIKCKDYGLTNFTVSLDGSNEEIVSKLRGKGVFTKTIKGIQNLIKHKLNVMVSTTVTNLNIYDLENIAELGKNLNVDSVRFNGLFYTGDAIRNIRDLYIKPKDYKILYKRIEQVYNKYREFVMGSCIDNLKLIKKWEQELPKENIINVLSCGAGTNKLAIRSDGEVLPCEIMWDYTLGNVLKEDIKDIWKNSKELERFRKQFILDRKDIGDCIDCRYRNICYTGHICSPYFLPEGLRNKEVFCISEKGSTKEKIFNIKGKQ